MTINESKIPYMRRNHILCKNVLIYTINNLFLVLEIIISKFSYSLKMMPRNTFPEPQPDSASYIKCCMHAARYFYRTVKTP